MTRITVSLLAIAVLFTPGIAQVTAAEACRRACEHDKWCAPAECCAQHAADGASDSAADRPHDPSPAAPCHDSHCKFCPGSGSRPLIVSSHRLDLSLNPAPMFRPTSGPMTSASFDVPFAIFHPPRA